MTFSKLYFFFDFFVSERERDKKASQKIGYAYNFNFKYLYNLLITSLCASLKCRNALKIPNSYWFYSFYAKETVRM